MSLFLAQAAGLRILPALLDRQERLTDAELFALDLALAEAADAVSAHIAARFPDPVTRAVQAFGHTTPLIINGGAK